MAACIGDTQCLGRQTDLPQLFGVGGHFLYSRHQLFAGQIFFLNDHGSLMIGQHHGIVVLVVFRHIGRRDEH